MAVDDVEFGHIVDLTLGEPAGTELVAAASVGATTLTVDYAGDFEDSGNLILNGEVLPYTEIAYGDAEADPDIITLAAPLAVAAAVDDKVGRMAGGEPVADWLLHVSLGDGHAVDIPIPYEQRAMWSNVDLSAPVPVFVSADLERLVEVPGRPPRLDQAAIDAPGIALYQATDVPWIDTGSTFAPLTDWTIQSQSAGDFTYNGANGKVTIHNGGRYLIIVAVNWSGSSTGRRYIRLVTTLLGVDTVLRTIGGSPPDSAAFTQQIQRAPILAEGQTIHVEARQTSGATLDVSGDSAGAFTGIEIVRLQA